MGFFINLVKKPSSNTKSTQIAYGGRSQFGGTKTATVMYA
ncbi:hypothetical protein DFA_11549 [Cavenderia fasciculata]|uniref:Uncharacterized protein n=1 Tax=Cavenderia fasciculata TaxID=261658 RepID=F4QDJ1_CACFS|nr:uncharacterized protein DFA_11549 [Cavenderia fasciculata]EGG13788.1 hypothetical protein DFA_11549 [Cavenderia fasciculata]|eukprot:XP_004350496.1 hypothetical protein DFA_11549 [Cavenderia fasciculata]